MGIADKLMFWKKEPELGAELPSDIGANMPVGTDPNLKIGTDLNLGADPNLHPPELSGEHNLHPASSLGTDPPKAFEEAKSTSANRDIELLSAKIDTIKATLENINQRLINIERIAKEAQEPDKHEIY